MPLLCTIGMNNSIDLQVYDYNTNCVTISKDYMTMKKFLFQCFMVRLVPYSDHRNIGRKQILYPNCSKLRSYTEATFLYVFKYTLPDVFNT